MSKIDFFSVEKIAGKRADVLALFTESSPKIFKETSNSEGIKPQKTKEGYEYMPWGIDNQMPYDILEMIEKDETINTCQQHNIKNCYAAGLEYVMSESTSDEVKRKVKRFMDHNDLTSYYLGVCTDMKFWQWSVSLLTINKGGNEIASIQRLEAMYCRVSPFGKPGSRYVYYGQWRDAYSPKEIYRYPLLDMNDPLGDLEKRLRPDNGSKPTKETKFAIITRMPTPDATYYPIPYYASLFKGKWYDIKQLIALGKYAKLKNAAPLKYLVQIENGFWDRQFEAAGITSEEKEKEFMNKKKTEIIDFLTGVENSGRAIFSGFFIDPVTGKEVPDIRITNLESGKEGGDWESDIQEAINMVCFVMGVHSNLVGSVPGKSQSNNSGSDKRELYIIAQLLNRPTHDLLMRPHRVLCAFNNWEDVKPECQIMQLTTLDEHKDVKKTKDNGKEDDQ